MLSSSSEELTSDLHVQKDSQWYNEVSEKITPKGQHVIVLFHHCVF